MSKKLTRAILTESYQCTKKMTGIDPSKPGAIKRILGRDKDFDIYVKSLSEGLETEQDRKSFKLLAENTRIALLENSMSQLNPYESLALPLLRVFYPKTIAKDLVTVIPMDKPEIVRGFVRATFKRFGDRNTYFAPSSTDITGGSAVKVPITNQKSIATPIDILAIAGVTKEIAHIERVFAITGVEFNTGTGAQNITVTVTPSVDGLFSATITDPAGVSDTLTGSINYETGILTLSSVSGYVKAVAFSATLSLENNTINPRTSFTIDKLRLVSKDRQISTDWTIQAQQDIRALYDIDLQTELVSIMGQQLAQDIDIEIITNLIAASERLNPATHSLTFNKNPQSYNGGAGYQWGPKQWMENILPKLTDLSNVIYKDTNIGSGNTIACNPMDAGILEMLNTFKYTAQSGSEDGELGFDKATLAGGKYRVLTSNNVPQGKMVMVMKPQEQAKAVSIFSPYVPAILSPYPLGNNPSLTILSRYGTQMVRPAGIAVLNITDDAQG